MCDVEALIAEINKHNWGGESEDYELPHRIVTFLEGLVSDSRQAEAPTGDDRETLHNAIRETVIRWEDCGGNIEHMLKESLSGFRLPVVSVPVYEYGEKFPSGDIFPHRSRIAAENSVDDWNVNAIRLREEANGWASYSGSHIVRRTAGVAPGSWELVPVGVDKP